MAVVSVPLLGRSLLSLAANAFFRKSFSFREGTLLVALPLAAAAAAFLVEESSIGADVPATCLLCFAAAAYTSLSSSSSSERGFLEHQHLWMRSVDLQDLINFVVTLALVTVLGDFSQHDLSPDLLSPAWAYVPCMSVLQLARNPRELKEILRRLRVAFGPASILAAVCLGWLQMRDANVNLVRRLLGLCCALSSFLAGFVFRPDNRETFDLFMAAFSRAEQNNNSNITAWILAKRTKIHGYLNVFSVFLAGVLWNWDRAAAVLQVAFLYFRSL